MTLVETIPASSSASESSSSSNGHADVVLTKKRRQSDEEEANSHLEYFTNALVMFVVEGRSRRSVSSNQRQLQQQQHASCLFDRLVARLIAEAQLADSSHHFLNGNQNPGLPPLRYDYPDIAQVSYYLFFSSLMLN